MSSEHGQASVEWTGLLLLLTVAFTAALSFVPGGEDRSLGRTIARRLVCTVRGGCGVGTSSATAPGAGTVPSPVSTRGADGGRPAAAAPVLPARPSSPAGSGSTTPTSAGSRVLGGVKHAAKRAWILCFAYDRYLYERAPSGDAVLWRGPPPGDVLKIANDCLNPLDFLFGG